MNLTYSLAVLYALRASLERSFVFFGGTVLLQCVSDRSDMVAGAVDAARIGTQDADQDLSTPSAISER